MPETSISLKISPKGALSVYGLQRFPVTLYAEQWEAIFQKVPAIRQFIQANRNQLTRKEDKNGAPAGATSI